MPRVYVPATYRAALMDLKRGTPADYAKMDAIQDQHKHIARRVFDAIMTGEAAEAHQYYCGSCGLIIYHRSTRGNYIQESHFFRGVGTGFTWEAISHHDVTTPDDIQLQPGTYITITA